MKNRISITINEDTLENLDAILQEGLFRNRSHLIEFSLNKFLKDNENGN